MAQIAAGLGNLSERQSTELFSASIAKVVWSGTGIELAVDLRVLHEHACESELPRDNEHTDFQHSVCVPLIIRQKGQETRIALPGRAEVDTSRQTSFVRAIARARDWWNRLLGGTSMEDVARQSNVSVRYIQQLLPLAFLAPRLVTDIVEGNHASDLTLERLLGGVKLSWRDQLHAVGD